MHGAVIYLNANPDLQLVLDRVSAAGGQIIMGKTLIDDKVGYMAFIVDTEGNKVGLHCGHE
jgi:predicted enzyme related to lactoylglutathione lyase